LEEVAEEEDEEDNSFDHNDKLSVSLPSNGNDDDEVVEVSSDEISKAQKGKRGRKRVKAGAGVSLSPSKCKVARGKRAGCWKYFKVINVPSSKERGVMVTKAKCRFCTTSYTYHPGGSTTQMNHHLKKCTQYLNKLSRVKRQGTLNLAPDEGGSLIINPTEYDHAHTRLLIA